MVGHCKNGGNHGSIPTDIIIYGLVCLLRPFTSGYHHHQAKLRLRHDYFNTMTSSALDM